MNTTNLISVIVPVCNTEPYLSDCIRSVLAQTHSDLELILVDDKPEDKSSEICQEACRMDSRVIFLSQERRKGVSAARNRAIGAARGSYLFFLDSDDMIHPGLLKALLCSARQSGVPIAAVVPCRVATENFSKALCWMEEKNLPAEYTYLESRTILDQTLEMSPERNSVCCGIGGKLIRKEDALAVRFDETLCNGEDTKYLYQILEGGADAVVLKGVWYYYRMHPGNVSKNRSAEACMSMYRCKKYICGREWAAGETGNVICLERMLINYLLEWYRLSRKNRDTALRKCMERALNQELRSEECALLPLRYRAKIVLALYSYPVYRVLHIYFGWRWEQSQRKKSDG